MRKIALSLLTATAVLAACGGSDHQTPPATSEVPASASESSSGFIDYLEDLVSSMADMLEPVDTTGVAGATSDTKEPTSVD